MSQKQGLKVTQVLKEKSHLTKILPEYLSNWVTNRIRGEGVEIIEETTVKSANLDESGKVNFTTNSGKTVQVDHVVVAVGKFELRHFFKIETCHSFVIKNYSLWALITT